MDIELVRLYLGSVDGPFGAPTPIHGYAIKHPKGVVLIDTGIGDPGGAEWAKTYNLQWRTMEAALGDHDLSLADVQYLMITHLDHDHMGQNFYFKGIPTIVQRKELEFAREVQDEHTRQLFEFEGAKLEAIDGDTEVLEGIKAVWTPGHSPGHQSVLVGNGDGSALIIGDAAYTRDVYDKPRDFTEEHPGYVLQVRMDKDLWVESIDKLHALEPDVVHFCHDNQILGHSR
jgi:glyoxylase-like metal-dependent hydrolase (beta-lactamase superfamily II)